MSTFNQTTVSYDTFSLTLEGYSQLSLIDLTKLNSEPNQTTNILNNIDLNINTSVVPKKRSTTINFNCDINFSVDIGADFPNFLQRPYPNLTLFKKANEFSHEVSKLNDTIIRIFQQMECCGISDEYNKTVVPFFRYIASTPEHTDCGNSPNLAPNSCGAPDGIMEPILQAVKNITKVYTAIEPIFCLISPIPGNPWLPIDFNWMMPILPYLQSFNSFMDYIMSGTLFDIIIDPVKNLNRMLISCTESVPGNNFKRIDTSSSELIKLMEKVKKTEESINVLTPPKTVNPQEALKLTQRKLNREAARKKLLQQTIIRNKYQTFNITNDYYEINIKLSNIRNSGRGICVCIMKSLDLELRLPKFPNAKIRILPQTANETYNLNSNDLLKYKNEETYSITLNDIYKDNFINSGTVIDTNFSNKKNINLTTDLTTDMDFINKFKIFIEESSQMKNGYDYNSTISAIENSQLVTHIPTTDFIKKYVASLPNLSFFYTDKSDYLKKVIDQYDTAILNTSRMSPSEILEANRNFITKIKQLEEKEFHIKSKMEEIYLKDKENWKESKSKADLEFKYLKAQAGKINTNIENLRLQQMYNDFFGSYKDMNIATDINDTRIHEKFWQYSDLNDTNLYAITLKYLNKRVFLFGFSDTDYKTHITEQLNKRGIEFASILGRNNLTFDITKTLDEQLQEISTKINALIDPTSENYKKYKEDIAKFLNAPLGLYLKDYLFRNYPKDIKLEHNDIYFISTFNIIDEAISKITSSLPTYAFSSGEQENVLFYTIQILQIEKYKLKLFEILETNIAFEFYLAFYPNIDCTCESLVCKLLQMIIEYLLQYIRKMIAQILQLVIEYLIPQWLRALIDLIIYKLKCVLEIVYMKQNLNLIDTVYSNLLQSMKYRVSNYPYEGCVDKALQDALDKINEKNKNNGNINTDGDKIKSAEEELKTHNVKIDFVDFNKRPILITRLKNWKNVSLKVEVDIGATIEYVVVSDKTIPGKATQTFLPFTEIKKNIMYIYDIPIDKIISGKIKAVVKSNKPFADEKIKFDETSITIDDFLDKSTMGLILSDYRTSDRNIFLESSKDTLLISFNIVPVDTIGDPTADFNLIPKYIKTLVLLDNPPFGSNIIALPEKSLKIEDVIKDSSFMYNVENNLFSFVVDCINFFPANRNINGVIETFDIYDGLTLNAQDTILCKETNNGFDAKGYLNQTTEKFIDTIIYSDFVQAPFNEEDNTDKEPGDINNIEVRKNNPVIYDCSSLPNSNGTSFMIQTLYNELHETWKSTGLI